MLWNPTVNHFTILYMLGFICWVTHNSQYNLQMFFQVPGVFDIPFPLFWEFSVAVHGPANHPGWNIYIFLGWSCSFLFSSCPSKYSDWDYDFNIFRLSRQFSNRVVEQMFPLKNWLHQGNHSPPFWLCVGLTCVALPIFGDVPTDNFDQ